MKKSAIALIIVGILLLSVGGLMYFLHERDQNAYEADKENLILDEEMQELRMNIAMGGFGGGALFLILGVALSGALSGEAGGAGGGGSIEKDILYVIRAMTVLLSAGVGLESTMEHVAKSSYGEISLMFDKILTEAKKGEYIEDALQREANTTSFTPMRKVLNTLVLGSKGEVDLVEALSKIAEREMRDREMEIDKFIETLGARSEVYMTLGILVPIIVVVVIFVATLIKETGLGSGGSMDVLTKPPAIAGLLFADLGILGFIAAKTKIDEPKI